jgi:hypothetical protein
MGSSVKKNMSLENKNSVGHPEQPGQMGNMLESKIDWKKTNDPVYRGNRFFWKTFLQCDSQEIPSQSHKDLQL